MNFVPLSAEQAAALAPEVQLIEAGPGAGKTKTVVARFKQASAEGRGVALLSFTNAAVDVARSQCRETPTLAEAPNFIGTFDQFFHRYVLTPYVRRRFGVSPQYLSSWDDLPEHIATIRPRRGGVGIRLAQFVRDGDGWVVNERRLSHPENQAWEKLSTWSREQMESDATKRISGLHDALVFDTAESRTRALGILQDDHSSVRDLLARRFKEVIVDEFQDCDEVEHQLLSLLRAKGMHVVTVADPDQAIYEFRQSTSGIYERYRNGLDRTFIARLTTCYRSSSAICSLTSSLRAVGLDSLQPDPDHKGGADQVHVVVGAGVKAGYVALEIVRQHGVPTSETRVIAHRRSDARALVRVGKQPPNGDSHLEALLVPLAELRSGADARGRLAAAKRVEAFVLNQFGWPMDGTANTRVQQLELLDLAPEQLRVIVSRLLVASRQWPDKKACSVSVRGELVEFGCELPVPLRSNLGRGLVVPDKVWKFWESRTSGMFDATNAQVIRWTHVHGVKGDEFDAVVLAIPGRAPRTPGAVHVLEDWQRGVNSEQRRVLYVGASRAGKILVLVVPKARRDQLIGLLTAAKVPHSITEAK